MAFVKEKTVVVTVDDFISPRALSSAEFTGMNGEPCLIQVLLDEYCENPRRMFDPLWTWVTTQGAGYSDVKNETPDDYEGEDGKLDTLFLEEHLVIPLYLYRHSGDAISLGREYPFDCPFDSGCMGFAYVNRKEVLERFGWNAITKTRRAQLIQYLQNEVDEMNAWLSGEVYGVQIIDMQSEQEDSCWGFIGRDYLKSAAVDMLCGWAGDAERPEIVGRLAV
jgi:hypothetical protein